MSVLVLWLCFLAVVVGIGLSLVVLLRELQAQVAARRAVALEADDEREVELVTAAPAVPAAPRSAAAVRVAASSTPRASVAVPAARRGLGAPGQGSGTAPRRPVSGRGLGSATPVPPRPGRATHRGLGRRPHA